MLSLKGHKERVEILSGNTIKSRKKYKVENNTVVIEKAGKGRGHIGWTPKYSESSFIYKRNIFGILKRKLVVIEGSDRCIDFKTEDDEARTYPVTIQTIKQWYEAKLLEHAGQSTQNIKVPILLYLLIGGVLILEIFNFLVTQGMIRP